MRYYKDINNEVYADPINLDGLTEITKAEVDAILEPTPEEALEATRSGFKTIRDNALSDNEYALLDGSVFQVRPDDLSNFQLAIQLGQSKVWLLKDNTTRLTTVVELTEIMSAGIVQAEAIWDEYITSIGTV